MAVLTQGIEPLEWLVSEASGMRSRENATVVIAGAVALPSGQVLGRFTSGPNNGKYAALNTGASDGTQTPAAVLGTELPGVNGDTPAMIFARDIEAFGALMNGGTAPAAGVKTTLATLGIIVR